jgi:hypothetical protein
MWKRIYCREKTTFESVFIAEKRRHLKSYLLTPEIIIVVVILAKMGRQRAMPRA